MAAVSLSAIVLALLGAVPGETTGWGTGSVWFKAYVNTSEHQEVYPVGAGQYTVEVTISEILDDPADALGYITKVDVSYATRLGLVAGAIVEVRGTYYNGACPLPYCGRVKASAVSELNEGEESEEEEEEHPELRSPRVLTGSAEATETTVTLQAVLTEDGGESCRARFVYKRYEDPAWHTEWIDDLTSQSTISQKVAGLIPGTRYYFYVEARNSVDQDTGRQGSFVTLEEKVPPIVHPTAWRTAPDQSEAVSIAMTADIERDLSGPQEYFFDFVASPTGGSGGSDSLWQFSPIYADLGLNLNHQYGYRVKARDGHGNETAYSPIEHAYTDIETPSGVTFGAITTSSIEAKSSSVPSGLTRGKSGLKLENITAGDVSLWQQTNAFWTSDTLWPNSLYTFRVRARNGDGDLTPFSPEASIYTLALVPTAPVVSEPTVSQLFVRWAANGNPDGTQYQCQNTTKSTSSAWMTGTQWPDAGLSPNVQYTYRVKARNGDGVETAFSAAVSGYSAIEKPTGIVFGTVTPSSIQVRAQNTPSGLERGESGLWFENVTTGQTSPWRRDNGLWTSEAPLPNHSYGFRVRARNGDGDLTPFSPEASIYTLALVPTAPVVSEPTVSQLFVRWAANGNPDGTQYQCQNTTKSTSSAWMTGTQWPDAGLSPNVQYAYHVKARNGDGVETAFSAAVSAYSAIEKPTGIVFGTVTSSSIQVRAQNTPSGLERGESGLWFENVTTGQTSPWRRDNGLWTSAAPLPNHSYGFRVRARNGDGVQTPASETASVYTAANVPVPGAFTGIANTSIQVQWGTNGNPSGTLYLCENTTAGTSSGWTPGATWEDCGLLPNTSYTYRVKARNADSLETAWATLGTQSTDYRSLTLSATPGGTVSTPAQSVVRCAPGATIDLVATPQARYHFLCWTGTAVDAGRVANPAAAQTTVLVDAHYTLMANFIRTQTYVDKRAVGADDGSSWTNAYKSLQDALDAAQVGNEIRVAQGVYKPDAGKTVLPGDRTATFDLKTGVIVKGGYAGLGKPDPNARDVTVYETVLSGDLKGDDGPVAKAFDLYGDLRRTDNSLHVVSVWNADSATVLEGVTITAGNGVDGAGLCLVRSHLVISQCAFRANRAGQLSGDGLEGWGEGAGVSCYQSEPVLRDCVFLSNWAGGQGGGLFSIESSPTLTDCVFQDNEAGGQGGAVYIQDGSQVCLGCTFHGNWSRDGGAIYSDEGSASRVTNCRFLGNAAHGSGGAVFAAGLGVEMINSVLSGNLAFVDGGAAVLAGGAGLWTNCTFNRNIAEGKQSGQALAVQGTTAVLTNCILWDHVDNTQGQLALTGTAERRAEVIVSYCDVLAGAGGVIRKGTVTVTWGTGNLNIDPRFLNPDGPNRVAGTLDDDLHLNVGSPCLDAGSNVAVLTDSDDLDADGNRSERVPFDLDGRTRFVDIPAAVNTGTADAPLYPGIVDLGAYEFKKP